MNPELRLRLGWIAVVLLFAAAAALLYVDVGRFRSGTGVRYGRATLGAPAPNVMFDTLDGSKRPLRASFGKPLIVNFFATWCVPCKAELPLIESRYVRLRPQGLTVLGVDEQETAKAVRAFTRAHGVTYPLVIDSAGSAFDVYAGHAIPTSLFIDRNGVLRAVHVGYLTADILDDELTKIM